MYLRELGSRFSKGAAKRASGLVLIVAAFCVGVLFPIRPALAAEAGPKLVTGVIGMYVHQHWPYKHPYAARTWTLEDWRGYAGGLKKIGYNTIMIWPMLETMPEPLTPSDR